MKRENQKKLFKKLKMKTLGHGKFWKLKLMRLGFFKWAYKKVLRPKI